MQISSRAEFPADPTAVFGMLTTQGFLEDVAKASGATDHRCSVQGTTTVSERSLPSPEMAKKFVGSTITVHEEVTWGDAAADGSRSGQVRLTVPGQPFLLNGTVTLKPGGAGSVVDLNGDLKVSIPLLGKKLEEASAPAILEGFKVQENVGRDWLSR